LAVVVAQETPPPPGDWHWQFFISRFSCDQ